MRMLLNDIIRTHYVFSQVTGALSDAALVRDSYTATAYIDDIAQDICATVPQCTGCKNTTSRSKAFCTAQRLRSYTLLFPLYVAGLYAGPATQIKPWIIKQMQFISDEMGIRNASVVAETLERGDATCPWDVYAMLGSYAFAA